MIYLIYVLIAILGSILVMMSMHVFGVADIKIFKELKIKSGSALKKDKDVENKEESDIIEESEDTCAILKNEDILNFDKKLGEPYGKWACVAIFILSIAGMFGMAMTLDHYVFFGEITAAGCFNFAKLFEVFVVTAACALIDLKKRIIPNKIIIIGLIFRALIYIGEIIVCRDSVKDIAINDLIGFAIGFGILFIAGVLSKGAIGFGDAKLFAVIGLSAGSLCTFGTLLFSLFCSAIVGIILLIKFRDKKMAFPFGPCIFIGYAAVLLMGNF